MTPFAFSGLLTFITCLSMGIFVLIKSPHSRTNRLWAFFTFTVALWGLGSFKVGSTHDPQSALNWLKIGYIGVIFIPITFLHFVSVFLDKEQKPILIPSYLIGLLFLLTLLSDNLITDIQFIFNSFYYNVHPSFLYLLFFIFWCHLMLYSYFLAYKSINTIPKNRRNQIKYFLLSTTIGYFGGITNFFPIFGLNIYPYGNFLVALFPVFATYVILKYNLLDINIVIRKSLIYSFLVTAITLVFLILVLISERIFHYFIQYKDLFTSIFISGTIALIFTPLRNTIQNFIDRSFFKGTQLEISQENELLRQEVLQTERLRSIATLASGMAHEIKNPLTVLKTFTEYLPNKLDDKEFLKKFTPMVAQEVERIDNLVHELLDFAKPAIPVLKPVNIHNLITNTLELLSNEHIKHSIKVNTDYHLDPSATVMLDYNQMKQALLNIFLNAIDAMPGGGQLNISTYSSVDGEKMNIKIQDSGIGIEQKDLTHIFDPFYSKKDSGTGLGLAITYEIIKNHGGKIFVESAPGKGTAFILEFTTKS